MLKWPIGILRLRKGLMCVRKYQRPPTVRGIIVPEAYREDHSRSLWEFVAAAPDVLEDFALEPEDIIITPPRVGVHAEAIDIGEGVEAFLVDKENIIRVIKWQGDDEVIPKGRMLVKLVEEAQGTIISVRQERSNKAEVVRSETEGWCEGDLMLLPQFAGTEVEVDGERLVSVKEDEVIAKIAPFADADMEVTF